MEDVIDQFQRGQITRDCLRAEMEKYLNRKHIVFFSSGAASWAVAKRVVKKEGVGRTFLLYTDTLGEDADNYRFLVEGAANVFGLDISLTLRQKAASVPPVWEMEKRKSFLEELRDRVRQEIPNLVWIIEGRTIWEVFQDNRFIGNSRIDPCSRTLKREQSKEWITSTYNPEEAVLYLGIDWSEEHRTKAPVRNWDPYQVEFPLLDRPFLTKQQIFDWAQSEGLKPPAMYEEGFDHANCAGLCVKAGQGQMYRLLKNRPDVYKWHEDQMEETISHIGKKHGFIKKTINGTTYFLTLKEFREMVENNEINVDMFDIGGCACFA